MKNLPFFRLFSKQFLKFLIKQVKVSCFVRDERTQWLQNFNDGMENGLKGGHSFALFANSSLNDREMRPLHSAIQNIRFICRNPGEENFLNFHNGLLSFQLTTASRSAQCGQIDRHSLAGIPKGHLRNSKIFLPVAL